MLHKNIIFVLLINNTTTITDSLDNVALDYKVTQGDIDEVTRNWSLQYGSAAIVTNYYEVCNSRETGF
jgi:hypothetical protein